MLDEFRFVKKSTYRTKVVKSLAESPKTSTQIADETKINRNNIYYILKQLKDHNIVQCINPEVRKGKLYKLTDLGEEIISYINFNFVN